MLNTFKRFLKEEDGLGTVEIVIIIAVLVGIALIFRNAIFSFAKNLISKMFPKASPDDNSAWTPTT
ncbi:MAG: hypothetical protein N2484_13425 [Clostridia bacterium]|nr:hypothetical protein [Clostridia bacterium]